MKKAILVISFGTSYAESARKSIDAVVSAIRTAYPGRVVRKAYTSAMIRRILEKRGESVPGVEEAMAQLRAEGFEDIIGVSTHFIPGIEYEKAVKAAGVPVSEPLLANDADLKAMAEKLGEIASQKNRTLIMMGHGTDHAADDVYFRLRSMLPKNVFVACVEGECALETILPELDSPEDKKIMLMPLMLVAGDHAKNDMSGDDEDSWKSILTARGFDVEVCLQGMGELEWVQKQFVRKAGEVFIRKIIADTQG